MNGLGLRTSVLSRLQESEFGRLQLLYDWPLETVGERVRKSNGWTWDFSQKIVREYRRFLCLHLVVPDQRYGLCSTVDEVWHTHILDTMDYCRMSAYVFGGYLHHQPCDGGGDREFVLDYRRTIDALLECFSEFDEDVWHLGSENVISCAGCVGPSPVHSKFEQALRV